MAHKEATTDRGVRELEEIAHTLLKLEDENPVSSNHEKYSSNDVTQVIRHHDYDIGANSSPSLSLFI